MTTRALHAMAQCILICSNTAANKLSNSVIIPLGNTIVVDSIDCLCKQQMAKIIPHEHDAMVTRKEASSTTANQMNWAFNVANNQPGIKVAIKWSNPCGAFQWHNGTFISHQCNNIKLYYKHHSI